MLEQECRHWDPENTGDSELKIRTNSIPRYSEEQAEAQEWMYHILDQVDYSHLQPTAPHITLKSRRKEAKEWNYRLQDPPLGVSDNRACHLGCDSDDAVPRLLLHVLALERRRLASCL
jgi:hypothetical protein